MSDPVSIFDHTASSRRSSWQSCEPAPDAPSPRWRSLPREDELIAILEAPLLPGETARAGFDRKERELATCLLELDVLAAREALARLAGGRADDPLVAAFMRLTVDRRCRLQNLLAGARRRAACGQQRTAR